MIRLFFTDNLRQSWRLIHVTHLIADATFVSVAGACAAASISAAALGYALFVPQSQLFGRVISCGDSRCGPCVALTFDDGPWPESTTVILDILQAAYVRAAFFVIGRYVQRWPELVRRMHEEGHLIGNHTFDHHRL